MNLQHQYNLDDFNKYVEPGGGESMTEQSGYIPPKKQIESFIIAGERLKRAREEEFDSYISGYDEDFVDPTRMPNFDITDASSLMDIAQKGFENSVKLKQQQDLENSKLPEVPKVELPDDLKK